MTSTERPTIRTRVAYAGFLEHGFHGFRLFEELAGHETLSSMLGLAIRGTRISDEERAMLDDMATIVTVAEPRIWPLKLSRLVASYGRSFAGYAVGNLALDGALIGVSGCSDIARRFVRVRKDIEADGKVTEAVRRHFLSDTVAGFGVPFREADERVTNLTRAVEARSRHECVYWALFRRVADVVRSERNLSPNIGAALSAVALDLDFEPDQISLLALALASNAFFANVYEAAAQRAPVMQTLPLNLVSYEGPAPRVSPRMRSSEDSR